MNYELLINVFVYFAFVPSLCGSFSSPTNHDYPSLRFPVHRTEHCEHPSCICCFEGLLLQFSNILLLFDEMVGSFARRGSAKLHCDRPGVCLVLFVRFTSTRTVTCKRRGDGRRGEGPTALSTPNMIYSPICRESVTHDLCKPFNGVLLAVGF
jgi:hypothetical protein